MVHSQMMAPIPDGELPVPRLIVFYDDSVADTRPLELLQRTYHGAVDHGAVIHGVTITGDHWSGWHIPDGEAIAQLAKVARVVAPNHWTILEEQAS